MKNQYYAQFYHEPFGKKNCPTSELIEVCGSYGVMYLDGRYSVKRMESLATETAKKRGFSAARVIYGTFSKPLRKGEVLDVRNLSE